MREQVLLQLVFRQAADLERLGILQQFLQPREAKIEPLLDEKFRGIAEEADQLRRLRRCAIPLPAR